MTLLKITLAVVLVVTLTGPVDALTLRTPPFPGDFTSAGVAFCAVTNGTDKATHTNSVTMYDDNGAALGTFGPATLAPNQSVFAPSFNLNLFSPTWCKCVVPNKSHKCVFVYQNGGTFQVIPGE